MCLSSSKCEGDSERGREGEGERRGRGRGVEREMGTARVGKVEGWIGERRREGEMRGRGAEW